MRKFIRPTNMALGAAAASAYSLGILADGVLWLAGQVAKDAAGAVVGIGDPAAQAEQVYENIKTLVEAAGGTMADVLFTRTYILDRAHRGPIAEVRKRYFPAPDYPCSTLLIVSGLADPNYLLEVEAVAQI